MLCTNSLLKVPVIGITSGLLPKTDVSFSLEHIPTIYDHLFRGIGMEMDFAGEQ